MSEAEGPGPQISVRAHFERFPATVKGAFVFRGEDRDPHQVVLVCARVAPLAGRGAREVPITSTTIDVAPKRDVFVPFEFGVSELDPGWYSLECDLEVDGIAGTYPGGKRFVVPWPRATVRRGPVLIGRTVVLGQGRKVRVEQVDCGGESIKVHLVATPPEPVNLLLSADGDPIEVLDADFDAQSGRAKVIAYPVMRTHSALRLELSAGHGKTKTSAVLDVPLR